MFVVLMSRKVCLVANILMIGTDVICVYSYGFFYLSISFLLYSCIYQFIHHVFVNLLTKTLYLLSNFPPFTPHLAVKEYAFMKALHAHGFPTPSPIDQSRHIVAMSKVEGERSEVDERKNEMERYRNGWDGMGWIGRERNE